MVTTAVVKSTKDMPERHKSYSSLIPKPCDLGMRLRLCNTGLGIGDNKNVLWAKFEALQFIHTLLCNKHGDQ